MKKYLITVLILLAVFKTTAQDSVVYNLKQCIDLALKNNLTVNMAELQMESNESRLQQARAANLPSVSGYANQGINQGKSINPYTNTFINQKINTGQYGINANMNLWSGFSNYNTMRQNAFTYQAGKMDWEQSKMDITISVMLAYLQVLSNEEQLNQAQSQVEVIKQQVERLNTLDKNNAISPSYLYDTKGQLANDKLNYINTKASLASSKITLGQLMNVNFPPTVKFEKINVENEIKAYETSNDVVYSEASKNLPMIKAAEYRRLSAVKNVHASRGLLFPSLSLNGSVGTNYSDAALAQKLIGVTDAGTDNYVLVNNIPTTVYAPQYNFTNEKISFNSQFKNNLNSYVGLSLQFSIFNSLRTKTQITQSKISNQQAEIRQKNTTTALKSSIDQAHIDATSSYERYTILQEQVLDYSASFKIASSKFEKGAITTVDYVIAKSNNDKAKMNLIASKYDYILKSKVLDYYNGKLPL
ncbi:MAG: TolC family protein [Bacteroidia bacterium]